MKAIQNLRAVALASTLAGAVTATGATTNDWSFDIVPYLWVAGIEAETTLPQVPPTTPPQTTRFETRLSGGAMIAAEVHYQSFGLWADFAWVRFDSETGSPGPAFSDVNLETDFIHSTAALTWQLPLRGKFQAEVLAGARLWVVSEEITATGGLLPGFNAGDDNHWVDPIIGADLRYELSPRWTLLTKGIVGGASNLGWEVMSGVSYQCNKYCSVAFGYRFLHEDYSKGGFALDADIHGFILGVGFHF